MTRGHPSAATFHRRLGHPLYFLGVLLLSTALVITPSAAWADLARDGQWYLNALRVPEANAIGRGDGVIVAVIDSGVDANHPDLVGNVLPGRNMTGPDDSGWTDPTGHGTSMAAVIAGHGHGPGGADGILGIAPKAKILPITVPEGSLTEGKTYMSDAIDWAVDQGADIINISMSSGYDSPGHAIGRAVDAGVMIVAAAGNTTSGDKSIAAPASDPLVVAVSAIGPGGEFSPVSVSDPKITVSAPGVDMPTIVDDGTYGSADGTSSSTAIVSATFALAKARFPEDSRESWAKRVIANTVDKGAPGPDDFYGYGVIDPVGALTGGVKPLPNGAPQASRSVFLSHTAVPRGGASGPEPESADTLLFAATAGLLLAGAVVLVTLLRRRARRTN